MTSPSSNRAVLLTPPGVGAIGVVRLGGPDAPKIADACFRTAIGSPLSATIPGQVRLGVIHEAGEPFDEAVAVVLDDNGQKAFDFCTHGGVRVLERLLALFANHCVNMRDAHPQRPAFPFASLIEEEILTALAETKSQEAVRFLCYQRTHLVDHLEQLTCFAEQDLTVVRPFLEKLLDNAKLGIRLVQGIRLTIVGPPNSGKSTLFNQLLSRDAAIVSQQAGTTRDWVTHEVLISGWPVILTDTAGTHETPDALENKAVQAAAAMACKADAVIIVIDRSEPETPSLDAFLEFCQKTYAYQVIALNKTDKPSRLALSSERTANANVVSISARTGTGVDELMSAVLRKLSSGPANALSDSPCLFTSRQREVVKQLLLTLDRGPTNVDNLLRTELIGPIR